MSRKKLLHILDRAALCLGYPPVHKDERGSGESGVQEKRPRLR